MKPKPDDAKRGARTLRLRSDALYHRARQALWKGGSEATQNHLLQQCGLPRFLNRAQGCQVWDVDGNQFTDYLMGWGSVLLGHGHGAVTRAVTEQMARGAIFNVGHEKEVELAERLVRHIASAERVRFVASGSEATASAVRVARAATGREKVVRYGYHGWLDWCQAEHPGGIPRRTLDDVHTFKLRHPDTLARIYAEFPDQIACTIMEPVKDRVPDLGFLECIRDTVREHGSLLIFDEVKTGFRLGLGGAQGHFGIVPDLSVFGKALGNGYPLGVVAGRADVLADTSEAWVTGTFHGWPLAIAAAHATLTELETGSVPEEIHRLGRRLMQGFNHVAANLGLKSRLSGVAAMPYWSWHADEHALVLPFHRALVERGNFVHPTQPVYISHGHGEERIDQMCAHMEAAILHAVDALRSAGRAKP